MLQQLDRIQLAVPSADAAVETFVEYFDAGVIREGDLTHLKAHKIVLRVGDSDIEVLEPTGPGAVEDFVEDWGGGLFAAGFNTEDMAGTMAQLTKSQAQFTMVGEQIHLEPTRVGDLRAIISPVPGTPPDPTGLLRHIYEVTNTVDNLDAVVGHYVELFGLDAARFNPIGSKKFGYDGMLTLFNPPDRLDRIEVTQITDYEGAMGRFHKRRGNGLYMCFAEIDDFGALSERLERLGTHYALDAPPEDGTDPDVLFIHPKSLHGMLMGISATDVAWRWSSGAGYH